MFEEQVLATKLRLSSQACSDRKIASSVDGGIASSYSTGRCDGCMHSPPCSPPSFPVHRGARLLLLLQARLGGPIPPALVDASETPWHGGGRRELLVSHSAGQEEEEDHEEGELQGRLQENGQEADDEAQGAHRGDEVSGAQ